MPVFVTYPQLVEYGVPKFCRRHLLVMQRAGKFPLARQITDNRTGWVEEEIIAWVASRPIARAVAPVAQTNGARPNRFRRGDGS
jgi:hypothetical protein